ncbi:MAG: hypothetical protein U0401_28580 [Anaerolineae bacterium]
MPNSGAGISKLKQKKRRARGMREMLRLKALIAYYRGLKLETVARI